jgi:TrmH family RNA methyltransferase
MVSKNEIKYIQSLFHKKQRSEEKVFVAEGPKLAEELINAKAIVKHIYATEKWLRKNTGFTLPVTEVSDIELHKISNMQTPNEVVVIAHQITPEGAHTLKGNLTIVLDDIQDPGNMGTIIRIADWFGITQIVCSENCVELYNPKVVQATMGSLLRVDCRYQNFDSWSLEGDLKIFGALLSGENVYSIGKVTEGLLVIGNESKGITEPLLSRITHPVTIPKMGSAESLNAAVAAGIIVGCMVNG